MRDRTDAEVYEEIKGLVRQFGLHSGLVVEGERCCTIDELDEAAAHEVRQRREHNSTNMIVTTGLGDSSAGVYLPAPPSAKTATQT